MTSICASSFKASTDTPFSQTKIEVKELASSIGRNEDLRKHESANKPNLGAQKILGIIRDLYSKIGRVRPGGGLPTYETMKVLKDHRMELEERKSEAVAYWYRHKAFSCQ